MEKHLKQLSEWLQLNSQRIPKEVITKHFLLSFEKNDEFIEFFLLMGADPDANENQAMSSAVNSGDIDNIKLLRKYHASVNVNLLPAIESNNKQLVEYMLKEGSEVRDSYLSSAISAKNIDMINLLLKYNAKVNYVRMHEATVTSLEIVTLLLPYTQNKFPSNTFHDGDSYFGDFESLPSDVLKFVLDNLNKKDGVMSDIIASHPAHTNTYDDLSYRLQLALKRSIKQANITSMKFLVEYFEKNMMSFSFAYDNNTCSVLVANAKTVEDLNHILQFLKEHNVWKEVIRFSDYIPYLYAKCDLETLEILDITPTQECFKPAIEYHNKSFIEALLNLDIKPDAFDVALAFDECNNRRKVEKKYELSCEIVKMLVKAEP